MCSVFSPLFSKYLISWAVTAATSSSGSNGLGYPFGLAVGLLVLQVLASLFQNNFFQQAAKLGVRMRVAMSAIVYRKAVRLAASSRQEFSGGRVINIVSTDCNRIEQFITFAHIIWTAPVQLVVIVGFLISQIGWAALVGVAFICLVGPLQGYLFRRLAAIRRAMAPITDRRVKQTTELLAGIRVVKLFAWEDSFLRTIGDVRRAEVLQVFRRSRLSAVVMTVATALPVLSAAVSFVLYAITNPLEASRIFSALSWFTQLRFPLIFLPNLITAWADFQVAMTRIEALLMAAESDDPPVLEEGAEFGIRIDGADFEWEEPDPEIAAALRFADAKGRKGPKGKKGKNGA
ncbi:hypothetical protein HK405_001881, partial [Cladochytrium tenue]